MPQDFSVNMIYCDGESAGSIKLCAANAINAAAKAVTVSRGKLIAHSVEVITDKDRVDECMENMRRP